MFTVDNILTALSFHHKSAQVHYHFKTDLNFHYGKGLLRLLFHHVFINKIDGVFPVFDVFVFTPLRCLAHL